MKQKMKTVALLLGFTLLAPVAGLRAESVWDKPVEAVGEPTDITVYRSPTCGCCGKWIDHMKKHRFNVKDIVTNDMDSVKRKLGVPPELASCHTAVVNGYVIEGHVPAGDVRELLKTKPEVVGLSVPGMVTGSPGMEMGGRKQPFAVVSFDKAGKTQKFHEYTFY